MNTFKKVSIGLLVLVLGTVLRTLYFAGAFKQITPVQSGSEMHLRGITGAEDITIDTSTGMALVSSDDRRKARAGMPVKGGIFQLDLNTTPVRFKELRVTIAGDDDFHPHGISLYVDPTDQSKWLFAVNHRSSGHSVEIFQYLDSALVHAETIQSELFKSPNDLVAIGRRSFYFTNDHDQEGGVSSWKDFLVIGTGQVGYFDGKQATILAKGIRYANGITVSPDGKRLYVAACTDGSVLVFNRMPFKQMGKIACGTGVDNLEWDAEGNLWSGAHPKMLAFLGHAKDSTSRSPSEVVQINVQDPENPKVKTVYLNDGNPLSGSSVAAYYRGKLLVGSVFENGILVLEASQR